jgi:hypothetical protein
MKVNSQIKNLRQNLNITLSNQIRKPDIDLLTIKYKYIIDNINEILDKGISKICLQQLYQNVNDILLFDVPEEIIHSIENIFINYANITVNGLFQISKTSSIEEFFFFFNEQWSTVLKNFSLLRKILIKFEKKYYNRNYNVKNLWTICNFS